MRTTQIIVTDDRLECVAGFQIEYNWLRHNSVNKTEP